MNDDATRGDYKKSLGRESSKVSDMEEPDGMNELNYQWCAKGLNIVDAGWGNTNVPDPGSKLIMIVGGESECLQQKNGSSFGGNDHNKVKGIAAWATENLDKIRAIKKSRQVTNLNLELAAWQWCVNGLAQRWAEGGRYDRQWQSDDMRPDML